MSKKPTYYITTPIYYPSGKWHIGHCYTTVCCDALARFKRMQGFDVFYLTGTDEHGQKIEKRAQEAGQEPKVFVDALVAEIKELWSILDISYDKYIRTTDDYHVAAVQKIFKKLYDKGDIYKSVYKGKYCTPCEAFWTDSQLKEGKCPDCGREVAEAEEESYFFRLSKYAKDVRKLLTETDFLEPKSRVNEMINFIDSGLEDLAVSRTSFKWGIPVSFDDKHVVYVWIDALSNYITALGYEGDDNKLYKKYWPADVHVMAKEIVRFHAIIWPAILLALGEPLPKHEIGHGWIMFGGDKMSKSKGNVVDPFILIERYGVDSLRHYLLRDTQFGSDGNYTSEIFLQRINADLANDLGNLTKRTLAMSRQYFNGEVKKSGEGTEFDAAFETKINALKDAVTALMEANKVNKAVDAIFDLIGSANKYIDETKPWVLSKEGKTGILSTVIYNLIEAIRVSANLLMPFLTKSPSKIFAALNLPLPSDFNGAVYGKIKSYKTNEIETLFPRYDIKKELDELEALSGKQVQSVAPSKIQTTAAPANDCRERPSGVPPVAAQSNEKTLISIDEFFKTQLKIAEVTACEKVAKSEKLLKLTVKLGDEVRTVVSGIAKSYTPEELVGRQVVLVANLKPAKLCGIESQGMILCASKDGKPVLVKPEVIVESGCEVS